MLKSEHGRMDKKKIRGKRNYLARHRQKLSGRLHLSKNLHLRYDNALFMCVFQGHIIFGCALQNQYYPFKTNKPDPIARFRVQIAQLSPFLNRYLKAYWLGRS